MKGDTFLELPVRNATKVFMKVRCETNLNEAVFVVGSATEFGDWDHDKAAKMSTSE